MRYLALALVLAVTGAATVARSEDAIPDIKGTWTGKGKVLVYGNNVHNPGTQTMAEPYVHSGMGPSKSIVATCYAMERARRTSDPSGGINTFRPAWREPAQVGAYRHRC
jgi:hypothetical protein